MTLPNFIVIGAQRAGTTLLHNVLSAHPEIQMPRWRKEVHYFDWYFERGTQWYEAFFPTEEEAAGYRAIGEVTPDYLFEPAVPERISQVLPECRMIVSLRNPVDRANSWYLYARRSYDERRSLEDFLRQEPEVVERGRYSEQIRRYLKLFPRESFLVLIFEEFVAAPNDHLDQLADFLGLTHGWDDPVSLLRERVNDSQAPYFRRAFAGARHVGNLLLRHDMDWPVRWAKQLGVPRWFGTEKSKPKMSEATRAHLAALYADEMCDLEAVLDRDLNVWKACRSSSDT